MSGFSRALVAQQYTFEDVAAGLKHQDAATRLRAIQILKDADYAEAAAPIAATLGDLDDRVQLAAIDAERSLFTTHPVSRRRKVALVVEVRSIAGGDAAEGQLALKPRGIPTQVIAGLAAALRDGNPRVRGEAVSLISLLAPQACGFGESRVQSPESKVGSPESKVGSPESKVGSPGSKVGSPGSSVEMGEVCSQAGNALIDNINSRDPVLRRAAMQALGQLRYPNAVQALSDQLSYYQKGADAQAALFGLAGIGHPTSTSIFRQALTSANADMRRLAVEGLARAGARDALAELQQIGQNERSTGVLLSLHYAHIKLAEPGSQPRQLVAALTNASLRPLALKHLLDLAPSIAPALAESLRNEDPNVRRLVADVLGFSHDAGILPALEAARKDPDPEAALAVQRAIARIALNPGLRSPSAEG